MGEKIPDPAEVQGLDTFKPDQLHRSGYHKDKLAFLEGWIRKHPFTTLASGEGKVLLDEIDRLRKLLHDDGLKTESGTSYIEPNFRAMSLEEIDEWMKNHPKV